MCVRRLLWLVVLAPLLALCACDRSAPPRPANEDIELPSANARVAVVFVHGILGHAAETFTAAGATGWPRLMAEDGSLGSPVQVFSIAYASEPLSRASSIQEIATRLRLRMQVDKQIFDRFDKVIFVTHSMGGLVVRRLLLQLSREAPTAFAKVVGVFFLAVPAGGSDLAALASWVSGNPQFKDMQPEDFNTFLQADADDWAGLMRRRPADRLYPRAYCAYEVRPMGPVAVVPRSRAQGGCDESAVAFDRDHSSLVKPADRKDEVYSYVAARVRRLLADADVPLKVSIDLLSPDGGQLSSNAVLRSGDQYAIRVRASKPSWLYVFGLDSRRQQQRYFPSAGGGRQPGPVSELRVPSDVGQALTLDKSTGVEQILVFATAEPDSTLAAHGSEVPTSAKGGDGVFDEALEKRGAFVQRVRAAPASTQQVLESGTSGPRTTATLTFWHR